MLTDFQNSFTDSLRGKISRKAIIKYPTTPRTRRYATLWNKKKQLKHVGIMINDASQRSVATSNVT